MWNVIRDYVKIGQIFKNKSPDKDKMTHEKNDIQSKIKKRYKCKALKQKGSIKMNKKMKRKVLGVLAGAFAAAMAMQSVPVYATGRQSAQKETVKAENEKTTDYLFAYFVDNAGAQEQQIWFAASRDGNNWMDLNNKKPVLSVADSVRTQEDIDKTQNQAGVRDPFLVRSPREGKFYLFATDLCIGPENIANGTVGWGTSQFNGSHCLRVWESEDLVNWSEPWLADVAPADTTCAWAPEAIYDEENEDFIVYWSSMTKKAAGSYQNVYYSRTEDFQTFTQPQVFIDNGNDHIIDTTVIRDSEGNYYRGSAANGTIKLEKCIDQDDWLLQENWEEQGYISKIAGFSPSLEGPELFRYNEDDWIEKNGVKQETYGLYADNFGGVGYVPFYTTDIENADWIKTADNDYNFDTLHKRHGTILNLTSEEYDRVMEAYGPESIEVKKLPGKTTYKQNARRINPTGLVLTVFYPNGEKEDVTYEAGTKNTRLFTFDADLSKAGTQEVKVTYGGQSTDFEVEVEAVKETDKKTLAEFDFDDEDNGFISEYAKAEGSFTLKDSYDRTQGKALYLDGSSGQYLTVTDREGGSLLTGAQELTVSFDMKPDRKDTNWLFYAAPDTNAQTSSAEHYIGALVNNGKTTVERYHNTGKRPVSPSTETGSDWCRVDIVLEEGITSLYVNGELKSEVDSAYEIPAILRDNSILYLGKANWGSGEYCKGLLDNFRIVNYAMTQEELRAGMPTPFREALLTEFAGTIQGIVLDERIVELPDYDGKVTWKSESEDILIGEDGKTATVKQPAKAESEKTEKLTAVIEMYGLQKEITVSVTSKPAKQESPQEVKPSSAKPAPSVQKPVQKSIGVIRAGKKTVKAARLKQSKQTVKLQAKTNAGKLTYKVKKYPAKMKKYIKVSSKGVVTFKKGAKKGKYVIEITAAETDKVKKAVKNVTITVK